ncbi:hypothetical protein AAG906_029211 [Vitis piasezkii]
MAVEARHINLFPSQFIPNKRQVMGSLDGNGVVYGSQVGQRGLVSENLMVPFYSSAFADPAPAKADSGLTYNLPVARKRARDESVMMSFPGNFSFLGQDISLQIQQQQLEIDRFISQHMERVRLEIEERRKRHSRRIIAAVEAALMKRLKAKEEEIENIGKLNWALEERVKSLCEENQIWRDLAQTNEANANALRNNLEQVLSQVKTEQRQSRISPCPEYIEMEWAEEAESCCGSTSGGDGDCDRENEEKESREMDDRNMRWCRNCRKEEASVLLLPCRHLCLCTICGSTLHTCPICKSNKNASVHVNLS